MNMTKPLITALAALYAAHAGAATPAEDGWSVQQDYPLGLELTYQGAALADMLTTLDIKHHPNLEEGNPIIGPHPTDARVVVYFAATGALHAFVTRALVNDGASSASIKVWEYVTIGIEGAAVGHNLSFGLKFSF